MTQSDLDIEAIENGFLPSLDGELYLCATCEKALSRAEYALEAMKTHGVQCFIARMAALRNKGQGGQVLVLVAQGAPGGAPGADQ